MTSATERQRTGARLRRLSADRALFPKLVDKRVVAGAGHFLPHETAGPVATALVDVLAASR